MHDVIRRSDIEPCLTCEGQPVAPVPSSLMRSGLAHEACLLYGVLLTGVQESGLCLVSVDMLAIATGDDPETVARCLALLQEHGLIEKSHPPADNDSAYSLPWQPLHDLEQRFPTSTNHNEADNPQTRGTQP